MSGHVFKVEVEDSLGNDSSHEVLALSVAEARRIARNLHNLQFKLENHKPYPEVWTFVQGFDI